MKDILVFECGDVKRFAAHVRRSRKRPLGLQLQGPTVTNSHRAEQARVCVCVCVSATIYILLNSREDKRAAQKVLLEVDQEPLESTFTCQRVQR